MLSSFGFFGWIIVGGIAGLLAKVIMPGKDPGGCIVTVLLGVAGAVLMGFIGHAVGWYDSGEGAGFLAALVGAIVILFIYRLMNRRR